MKEAIKYSKYRRPQNQFWSLHTHETFLPGWSRICPAFANSVDPDQLASEEANWSGPALFVIEYVNLYHQPESINPIGWHLEAYVNSKNLDQLAQPYNRIWSSTRHLYIAIIYIV